MKKKFLIPLIAMLLLACLSGCTRPPAAPADTQPAEAETTAAASQAAEETQTETETAPHTETEAATEIPPSDPVETETEVTEETACPHTYRYKVTREPTCSCSGEKVFTCTLCGASYKEVLEPLDHAYISTIKAPDCVNTGSTTHRCKVCGDTYTDNYIPALGHNYGPWIVVMEPTELKTGLAKCTCSRCGEENTMVIPRHSPGPQNP